MSFRSAKGRLDAEAEDRMNAYELKQQLKTNFEQNQDSLSYKGLCKLKEYIEQDLPNEDANLYSRVKTKCMELLKSRYLKNPHALTIGQLNFLLVNLQLDDPDRAGIHDLYLRSMSAF